MKKVVKKDRKVETAKKMHLSLEVKHLANVQGGAALFCFKPGDDE